MRFDVSCHQGFYACSVVWAVVSWISSNWRDESSSTLQLSDQIRFRRHIKRMKLSDSSDDKDVGPHISFLQQSNLGLLYWPKAIDNWLITHNVFGLFSSSCRGIKLMWRIHREFQGLVRSRHIWHEQLLTHTQVLIVPSAKWHWSSMSPTKFSRLKSKLSSEKGYVNTGFFLTLNLTWFL